MSSVDESLTSAAEDEEEFGALIEEFERDMREGRPRTIDEFAAEHPRHEASLRRLLPAVIGLEQAASEHAVASFPGRIGPYRLSGILGRGGMGIVYGAHDEELDREVALKVLAPHLASDPDFAERFLREAQAAGRLDHPGIVRVFRVGVADAHSYYSMQLVHGGSLDELLRELRRRSDPRREPIAI